MYTMPEMSPHLYQALVSTTRNLPVSFFLVWCLCFISVENCMCSLILFSPFALKKIDTQLATLTVIFFFEPS